MAEEQEAVQAVAAGDEEEENDNPDYKPPAPKSLNEIIKADEEDESLRKYKQQLLGVAVEPTGEETIVEPDNPNCVIVRKLAICVEGRDDIEIDLTLPKEEIKKSKIVLKEGCKYRVKIVFHVQREIVSGLRYEQKVYRKGIKVDKDSYMVGSYAPKKEAHVYCSPIEDAPSGLLAKGEYKVESRFTDDDKHIYLEWEWHLVIKKDFE